MKQLLLGLMYADTNYVALLPGLLVRVMAIIRPFNPYETAYHRKQLWGSTFLATVRNFDESHCHFYLENIYWVLLSQRLKCTHYVCHVLAVLADLKNVPNQCDAGFSLFINQSCLLQKKRISNCGWEHLWDRHFQPEFQLPIVFLTSSTIAKSKQNVTTWRHYSTVNFTTSTHTHDIHICTAL